MRSLHRLPTNLDQYLVATVLALVPFYAFLTVWGSSLVGHYTMLRLWPEAVLLCLTVWVGVVLAKDKKTRAIVSKNRLAYAIVSYLVLNVLLAAVAHTLGNVGTKAMLYGLLINTRFLIWFLVVWVIARRSTWLYARWQKIVFVPLAIVAIFALVQFVILPSNFLAHFGYDKLTTIPPAQTINQDTNTIRAQSTLRGPNQLGAYLVLGLGLLTTATMLLWRKIVLGGLSLLALLLSFSRSAWLGFIAETIAAAVILLPRKQLVRLSVVCGAGVVLLGAMLFVLRHDGGVQNALFHVDRNQSTASATSDSGHASSFRSGISDTVGQPLGKGPGTAGPASVYNTAAPERNSESYFLNIGQELGVLGLGIFIWILAETWVLLARNGSRLSRGLLVTFVGLAVVNLFSYAWDDPTIAYLWWGLAAIALAGNAHKSRKSTA